MITEKEKRNRDELFRLMRENPDLPVIPMVEGELVLGSDYAYWMGSWGSAKVTEYLIDEWYGDYCVRFKDDCDAEDTVIEGIAESKYDGTKEGYELAAQEVKSLWKKAIVVYINMPE